MPQIDVRLVESPADLNAFVELAWSLYADDPAWTPPLRTEVKGLLGRKSNPYFEHAHAAYFLATRNGVTVGRISAQVCDLVQHHMGQGTGQWGFFDSIDDPAVASALFVAAERWLREQGMTRALGPFSLSIWDEPGLLIDGFARRPCIMMGHARPYAAALVEAQGYTKERDLYAYLVPLRDSFPTARRGLEKIERDKNFRLRNADKKNFDVELQTVLSILSDSWAGNWGYVSLTSREIDYAAKKLKPIIMPDYVKICEHDGVPVAFMLTLPNINEFTHDLNGNLFPFGFLKLAYRLRSPRSEYTRVPLMGVRSAYQKTRWGGLMALAMIEITREHSFMTMGASEAELSWILDDNLPMRNILEMIGSRIDKTYRIYSKLLV